MGCSKQTYLWEGGNQSSDQGLEGDSVCSVGANLQSRMEPVVVECIALLCAMKLSMELGHERADFEGDTQIVVNSVNSQESCLAWYGNLMEDAKLLLKHNPLWTISFIHREGNQAAHVTAKIGLDSSSIERTWFFDFPCMILPVLARDLNTLYMLHSVFRKKKIKDEETIVTPPFIWM